MIDDKACREAYNDFYHKIRAEVSYDHWCSIWRFMESRRPPPPPPPPVPRPEPMTVGDDWTEVPFLNATIILLIIAVLVAGIIGVLM